MWALYLVFTGLRRLQPARGGMLLLDNDKLYERCMFLRDHGRGGGKPYYNSEVTYKYMPFNVQAALGYAQFQRIDELVNRKREIFYMYKDRLKDIDDLQWNDEPDDVVNSVWATGLVFGKSHRMTKKKAIQMLQEVGIPSRPFFYPLSSLPAFPGARKKYKPRNPVAYDISNRGINLSCAFNLTEDQIDAICDGVRTILKHPKTGGHR